MERLIGAVLATAALLLARPAGATYSIIAVDPDARVFGAAGASCVPYEVDRIYGSVPGNGAFVAQANFDDRAFAAALSLLADGAGASDVLAHVSDQATFPNAPNMQYGIVDLAGGLVTWTGPGALPVAVDVSGEHGSARFGALGNVLTSASVLDRAGAGFRADACDMPEQLLAALEAASSAGEGDSRCTPEGRPANSAFLDVTGEEATIVHISVPDVSPADPIVELRARFDAWRIDHPCGAPDEQGGAGAGGMGSGGNATAGDPEDAGGCQLHVARPREARCSWFIALAMAALAVRPRSSRRLAVSLSSGPRARPGRRRRRAGSRT